MPISYYKLMNKLFGFKYIHAKYGYRSYIVRVLNTEAGPMFRIGSDIFWLDEIEELEGRGLKYIA